MTRSDYFSDRESRSGYFSDREIHVQHKFGSVRQQASVESADSRLCYLTSSEVRNLEQSTYFTHFITSEKGFRSAH